MNAAPAGVHSEGHRDNKARFADIFKGIYHWTRKRQPSPGAQSYAFESLGLVEFTPIGPSITIRRHLNVVQHPQTYINGRAVPTTGIGGLNAGQMALQPLYDPNTNTQG